MSLKADPAQAARYRAMLDELCEIGMEVNRVLCEEMQKDGVAAADRAALGAAANDAAIGVRRGIMLACSLERLMTAGPVPPRAPEPQAARRKPDPNAYHPDRGDRLDRPDALDPVDHPDAAPIEDQIARIDRRIKAAKAAIPTVPIPPDTAPRPPIDPPARC